MRFLKSNNKAPLFSTMHVALLLLCAVLLSSYAISGLYARYISKNTSSASARVIRFGDITLTESGDNYLILSPGITAKNEVKLDFAGSESATFVFVVITPSEHWTYAENMLKIKRGEKEIATLGVNSDWTYLKTDGDKLVFYRALEPNVVLEGVQIFTNQNGVNGGVAISSQATATDLSALKTGNDISISVKAIAVQSIGFENETEAWDSVKNN